MHLIYNKYFYEDKQKEIDKPFIEYFAPIMENIYHPTLIEEWRQNIDAAAYETKINQDVKIPAIKKKTIVMIKLNNGQQA